MYVGVLLFSGRLYSLRPELPRNLRPTRTLQLLGFAHRIVPERWPRSYELQRTRLGPALYVEEVLFPRSFRLTGTLLRVGVDQHCVVAVSWPGYGELVISSPMGPTHNHGLVWLVTVLLEKLLMGKGAAVQSF